MQTNHDLYIVKKSTQVGTAESWTTKAAQLHTQELMAELCVKATRNEMQSETSNSGPVLLQEITSAQLPPADSLWSSDEET